MLISNENMECVSAGLLERWQEEADDRELGQRGRKRPRAGEGRRARELGREPLAASEASARRCELVRGGECELVPVMGGERVTARAGEGRRAREGAAAMWRSVDSGAGDGGDVRPPPSLGREGGRDGEDVTI